MLSETKGKDWFRTIIQPENNRLLANYDIKVTLDKASRANELASILEVLS